ncbi:MAG: hypothetical protein MMC23_009326 [Stictis urceolatum]|nr:hypothetical protein [Stictis urceolata]
MASANHRISPALYSYLSQPLEPSLSLVTSVLNASSNWLLARWISVALEDSLCPTSSVSSNCIAGANAQSVLFVSFLRDWMFWRETTKRIQCDLPRHCKDGRFLFVDGLSGLFCPAGFAASELGAASEGRAVLRDSHLESVYQAVRESIDKVKGQRPECRVLLLLDGLDLLLAATGADVESLLDVVSSLRESVHTTVVATSAGEALLQRESTPLEIKHASFNISLAHQARTVLGVRPLSTGVAKDVSGVLRITRGTEASDDESRDLEEREVLYYAGIDGGVKVFERGSG